MRALFHCNSANLSQHRRNPDRQPTRRRVTAISLLLWSTTLALLASCGTVATTPRLTVQGSMSVPHGTVLQNGTLAVVELRDEDDDRVLAEQRKPVSGLNSPLPFVLQIDAGKLVSGHKLKVRSALLAQGWAQWLSEAVSVDAGLGSVDVGNLPLAAVQRPLAFQSTIRCGERRFVIGMAGDTMRLLAGSQSFDLREVSTESASGERLEAVDDASTFVETQRDRPSVSVRGQRYADCVLLMAPGEGKVSR